MKFLCGRPGCGKESTATLQIDAPSSTVSLVDPRISRDGVPLCARHADATSPPLGWTMNDLRSRNRALSAVPDEGSTITSTPPRVRPEHEEPIESGSAERAVGRMSRRHSIVERARQADSAPTGDGQASAPAAGRDAAAISASNEHRFKSSRPVRPPDDEPDEPTRLASADDEPSGPATRPNRRRDVAEEGVEEDDRFPWHFQFHDDEPEELQASSPLLSRAFRSSIG